MIKHPSVNKTHSETREEVPVCASLVFPSSRAGTSTWITITLCQSLEGSETFKRWSLVKGLQESLGSMRHKRIVMLWVFSSVYASWSS